MIGIYHGVWDLFHIGHLNALKQAKEWCDTLIVGVASDRLTYTEKKKTPVYSELDRLEIIKNIKLVDCSFLFDTPEHVNDIIKYYSERDIEPICYICGGDFGIREHQKRTLQWCVSKHIPVYQTQRTSGISTTDIINKLKR